MGSETSSEESHLQVKTLKLYTYFDVPVKEGKPGKNREILFEDWKVGSAGSEEIASGVRKLKKQGEIRSTHPSISNVRQQKVTDHLRESHFSYSKRSSSL